MRISVLMLTAALSLSGCASWFRPPPVTIEPEGGYPAALVDERPLAAQVVDLEIEATAGGIIVTATALPPTQGYWNAALLPDETDGVPTDTIRFDFRLRPPFSASAAGSVPSREVTAGAFVSAAELRGIRQITVTGAQNSLSRSR